MARKIFQDFAHVLCQRFIEVPSNRDLVNLFLLGSGILELNIMGGPSWFSYDGCSYPIEPFPYCSDARTWLDRRMAVHGIDTSQLAGASLTVDCSVDVLPRKMVFTIARFDLCCVGTIKSPDRSYTAKLSAQRTWGLGTVVPPVAPRPSSRYEGAARRSFAGFVISSAAQAAEAAR